MMIQLILLAILVGALLMTWRRVRQGAMGRFEGILWVVVWLSAGFVVWRPETTSAVARLVGVGRGADLVLYSAIIILLILVFRLHVAHDQLERQLTELIRHEALREAHAHPDGAHPTHHVKENV